MGPSMKVPPHLSPLCLFPFSPATFSAVYAQHTKLPFALVSVKPDLFLLISFLGGFEPVIRLIVSQSSGLVDLAQLEKEVQRWILRNLSLQRKI